MVRIELSIVNKLGLHARAASKFVSLASGFASDIKVSKDEQTVNGKSIMGIIMLAAPKGTVLKLTTEGADEVAAAHHLSQLVSDRFGEEE